MNNVQRFLGTTFAVLILTSGFLRPAPAFAATTPSLGQAASYGILSSTYTNTSAGTTVNGDIGYTTGPAVPPGGSQTNVGSAAPYATAGADQASALSSLNAQPCTFTFAPGAINLSTDTTHGAIGVYAPGVYCSSGAMNVGGPLSLTGSGTYIFRPDGALTSTAGASVSLSGASACDVFWTPTAAVTLGANTTFAGTIIDTSAITVGANTTWSGRALAFGGTVTTDTDTINAPSCGSTPAPAEEEVVPTAPTTGTITVRKVVVNNNGGTKVVSDFLLFVGTTLVVSGVENTFSTGSYTISETADAGYTATISGDCDSDGDVVLSTNEDVICTITNNDVAAAVVPVDVIVPVTSVPVVEDVVTILEEVTPVVVPSLPATGFAPAETSVLPRVLLVSGLAVCAFYLLRKKLQA